MAWHKGGKMAIYVIILYDVMAQGIYYGNLGDSFMQ